jgi:DNA-binding transcriptional LysR family regulator
MGNRTCGEPQVQQRWLGVELRHFSTLAAIARHQSFRGAAESLGYVPSAISQQVADLERSVGVRLVERRKGRAAVELTPAGRRLTEHGEQILAELAAARADLRSLLVADRSLALGVDLTIAASLLPCVLREFRSRAPAVEVDCVEESVARLGELLEAGELDLLLVELPVSGEALAAHRLAADPWVVLTTADSGPDALGTSVRLSELEALPLIGPLPSPAFLQLTGHLDALGHPLSFDRPWPGLTSAHALVAAGLGAAILPRLAVDRSSATRAIPLEGRLPARAIGVAWHRARRAAPLVDTFREAASAALGPVWQAAA